MNQTMRPAALRGGGRLFRLLVLLAVIGPGAPVGQVRADEAPPPAGPAESAAGGTAGGTRARGPVTNQPLPRFVSLKASRANVRRGPSLSHRIDWVYRRKGMPLRVVAEYGQWRKVVDRDGLGGWVHYALLTGVRTVLVERDLLGLHIRPDPASALVARLELGVIARLGTCTPTWCRISAEGYRGWAPKTALWGVEPDEIRR